MGLEEDSSGLGLGKCLDFYTPKPLFVTGQEEILKWQQTYTWHFAVPKVHQPGH